MEWRFDVLVVDLYGEGAGVAAVGTAVILVTGTSYTVESMEVTDVEGFGGDYPMLVGIVYYMEICHGRSQTHDGPTTNKIKYLYASKYLHTVRKLA